MNIEIGDLSGGNEWRLFSSEFGFNTVLNLSDENKIFNLSEQILKNLFNIDFKIADNLDLVNINSGQDSWGYFREDIYNIDVDIKHELFSVKLSFSFNELYDENEGLYFLGCCNFCINDSYLLSILPMAGTSASGIKCSTYFGLDQEYLYTDLTHQHWFYDFCFNVKKSIIDNSPTFTYIYRMRKNEINLTVVYYFDEEFKSNINKSPQKYFELTEKNITPVMIDRVKDFYRLINFHYGKIDLSTQLPDFTDANIKDAISSKKILKEFLVSRYDLTNIILVLRMDAI